MKAAKIYTIFHTVLFGLDRTNERSPLEICPNEPDLSQRTRKKPGIALLTHGQ